MTAVLVLILRVGLVIILYVFLWSILQSVWQDLRQQGTSLSNRKKPFIQLTMKMHDGIEKILFFQQDEITIGRAPNNTITSTDDVISANHARLAYHHTQWWLEDIGSTNGTFLNNEKISLPTAIINTDQFKCGNTLFLIRIDPIHEQGN